MKLKIYIYPGGPSLSEITTTLEKLNPPLSDPIKKQGYMFAQQIFERIQNLQEMTNPTNFIQNQTISDDNHTIVLQGRMNSPSFWEITMGRIFG